VPPGVISKVNADHTVLDDSFVNSLIFLNQSGAYETWVLVAVFMSIGLLVGGVVSRTYHYRLDGSELTSFLSTGTALPQKDRRRCRTYCRAGQYYLGYEPFDAVAPDSQQSQSRGRGCGFVGQRRERSTDQHQDTQ
jgi:hypothetical protein